jgi:hypothetical protein
MLTNLVKQEVQRRGGKIPTKTRIKAGRIIAFIAALPLFTSWMFLFAIPMMMSISPTLWAKDKMRWFKDGRNLR